MIPFFQEKKIHLDTIYEAMSELWLLQLDYDHWLKDPWSTTEKKWIPNLQI